MVTQIQIGGMIGLGFLILTSILGILALKGKIDVKYHFIAAGITVLIALIHFLAAWTVI